jgi:hypothetical protein
MFDTAVSNRSAMVRKIVPLAFAIFFCFSIAPAGADQFCAGMRRNLKEPLGDYLAYYRTVAAAKPNEALYAKAENAALVGDKWIKQQMIENPNTFGENCGVAQMNNLTLMAALQAALEFRHDHSWMHGGILRAQTDSVTSSQGWIVADPTLGAPMYRFLVHSLRDAYTAGKIPIPDEVRAALRSYP